MVYIIVSPAEFTPNPSTANFNFQPRDVKMDYGSEIEKLIAIKSGFIDYVEAHYRKLIAEKLADEESMNDFLYRGSKDVDVFNLSDFILQFNSGYICDESNYIFKLEL